MNLSHRLLSSALLAGAVFSITALPLTMLGEKPVTVQLEERPVFVGQLRELARPYLALATGISLGVGAVSLAVSSWRSAADKLERSEAELAALRQQLDQKNVLVEQLRFSETKLQRSGLEHFLQAEETIALRSASPLASTPQVDLPLNRPAIPYTVPNFDRPPVTSAHIPASKFSTAGLDFFLDDETELFEIPENVAPVPPVPEAPPHRAVQPVLPSTYSDFTVTPITEPVKIQSVASLPAAQSFQGFVRPDPTNTTANATAAAARSQPIHPSESSTQMNELLIHLKQVMTQIEQLQTFQSNGQRNRNG